MNKRYAFILLLTLVILGGVWLMFGEKSTETFNNSSSTRHVNRLPWQIDAEDEGITRVFSVGIGEDNLSSVTQKLGKLPELALFEDGSGMRQIEAFFSGVKLGGLKGGIIAELDTHGVDLSGFARLEKKGKPTPSGRRKYVLSKSGIVKSETMPVRKLVYLPAVDYTEDQLLRFFGQPKEKKKVTDTVENWYYPHKGLLITYNKDGQEFFYYAARVRYKALIREVEKDMEKGHVTAGDPQ